MNTSTNFWAERLSPDISKCLEELLGPDVNQVRIIERQKKKQPRFTITTRKNRIILRWPTCDQFLGDHAVLLEEYYHVVKQWNTGYMTRGKYLAEYIKHGYDNNKYELEAWDFVRQNIDAYEDCLNACKEPNESERIPPTVSK